MQWESDVLGLLPLPVSEKHNPKECATTDQDHGGGGTAWLHCVDLRNYGVSGILVAPWWPLWRLTPHSTLPIRGGCRSLRLVVPGELDVQSFLPYVHDSHALSAKTKTCRHPGHVDERLWMQSSRRGRARTRCTQASRRTGRTGIGACAADRCSADCRQETRGGSCDFLQAVGP